jgi:hypothetical protein
MLAVEGGASTQPQHGTARSSSWVPPGRTARARAAGGSGDIGSGSRSAPSRCACYLIVLARLLDTAGAKCQTFPDFERFSKAFPGQSSG